MRHFFLGALATVLTFTIGGDHLLKTGLGRGSSRCPAFSPGILCHADSSARVRAKASAGNSEPSRPDRGESDCWRKDVPERVQRVPRHSGQSAQGRRFFESRGARVASDSGPNIPKRRSSGSRNTGFAALGCLPMAYGIPIRNCGP